MMFRKLAILAAGLSAASIAHADPVSTGTWYTFGFDTVGSSLYGCGACTQGVNPTSVAGPAVPWTFSLGALGGTLTVTDAFVYGDQFEIFNFGSSLGVTSTPGSGGSCSNNITACLADPNVSKAVFALAAGSYSITGKVVASFSSGAGYFIVNENVRPAVPEPATWALMIGGLAFAGGIMRRRAATVSFA